MLREVRDSFAPGARTVTATDHFVARSLQRVVQRQHRDLLVVGSSRQGPEGRVRIGKRTRQLLCHFECALAVAPRGLHKNPGSLRRSGVGYDGGAEANAALALAASIAVAAGAELLVQTVVDDRLPGLAWSSLGGVLGLTWDEVIQAEMERMRDQAATAGQRTEARPDVAVARGRPAGALLALCERVDLLVIGSRRWGPTARLLLGSTGRGTDARCRLPRVGGPSSGVLTAAHTRPPGCPRAQRFRRRVRVPAAAEESFAGRHARSRLERRIAGARAGAVDGQPGAPFASPLPTRPTG